MRAEKVVVSVSPIPTFYLHISGTEQPGDHRASITDTFLCEMFMYALLVSIIRNNGLIEQFLPKSGVVIHEPAHAYDDDGSSEDKTHNGD